MWRRRRALVELTGWSASTLERFMQRLCAREEFANDLVEVDAKALDPTFQWSDVYGLWLCANLRGCQPIGLLPPGYEPPLTSEPIVRYAFALWSQRTMHPADPVEQVPPLMERHIVPDLFTLRTEGVARRRLLAVGAELERRLPGHSLVHLVTTTSGRDLVSIYVDIDSLKRVARMIG